MATISEGIEANRAINVLDSVYSSRKRSGKSKLTVEPAKFAIRKAIARYITSLFIYILRPSAERKRISGRIITVSIWFLLVAALSFLSLLSIILLGKYPLGAEKVFLGILLRNSMILIPIVLYLALKKSFCEIGLCKSKFSVKEVLMGLGFGLITLLVGAFSSALLSKVGLKPEIPSYIIPRNEKELMIALSVVTISVAPTEEVIFRGLALYSFGSKKAFLLFSPLVFSVLHYHMGLGGILSVYPIALLLSVFYLSRGNLFSPIAAHASHDVLAMLSVYYLSSPQ